MVPRGRVELPTPAFSGPRSTGELPRHRHNKRFYGKGGALGREKRLKRSGIKTKTKRNWQRDTEHHLTSSDEPDICSSEIPGRHRFASGSKTFLTCSSLHRVVEFLHPVF